MIRVVVGDAPVVTDDLVVRLGVGGIGIHVADPALAEAITTQIAAALRAIDLAPPACPLVTLRSRKRLAEIAATLAGAIAIVPITLRNARHLVELTDGIRAAGAAGIQLVWDGADRPLLERHVFAVLEHGRATPGAAPIVLAPTREPAAALRILVAHRRQR